MLHLPRGAAAALEVMATSQIAVVSPNQQQTAAHHHTAVAFHILVLSVLPPADPQLCLHLRLWSMHPQQMSMHTEVVYVVNERSPSF